MQQIDPVQLSQQIGIRLPRDYDLQKFLSVCTCLEALSKNAEADMDMDDEIQVWVEQDPKDPYQVFLFTKHYVIEMAGAAMALALQSAQDIAVKKTKGDMLQMKIGFTLK